MKKKVIISSVTLISSLAGYFYAKGMGREAMPYVMVGGFLGALLGESLAETFYGEEHQAMRNVRQAQPKKLKSK